MSWTIELKPSAAKQYLKLDRRTRARIREVLHELEGAEWLTAHPRVRPLTGRLKGDLRVRVGGWRLLATPDDDSKVLSVYAILPRGDAY